MLGSLRLLYTLSAIIQCYHSHVFILCFRDVSQKEYLVPGLLEVVRVEPGLEPCSGASHVSNQAKAATAQRFLDGRSNHIKA